MYRGNRSGLTLLEVVIASFLLAGLITVLGGMWVMHSRALAQSSHLMVAADLAEQEMARALARGFHGLAPSETEFEQVWSTQGGEIRQTFRTRVEILELDDDDPDDNLKLVRVTVQSRNDSQTGSGKAFVLETVCTDEA